MENVAKSEGDLSRFGSSRAIEASGGKHSEHLDGHCLRMTGPDRDFERLGGTDDTMLGCGILLLSCLFRSWQCCDRLHVNVFCTRPKERILLLQVNVFCT